VDAPPAEYEGIYERFAKLLDSGESDVDPAPLRLVADAYMLGRRIEAEPFE
jgi:D-galactose 1-dehydrogenase